MQGNPCPMTMKHPPGTWAPSCGSMGSPTDSVVLKVQPLDWQQPPPDPLRQNFWGRPHNLVSMSSPVSPMPSGVWRSQERWVRKVLGPDRGSKARSVTDRQARGKRSGVFYSLLSHPGNGARTAPPWRCGWGGTQGCGLPGVPTQEAPARGSGVGSPSQALTYWHSTGGMKTPVLLGSGRRGAAGGLGAGSPDAPNRVGTNEGVLC